MEKITEIEKITQDKNRNNLSKVWGKTKIFISNYYLYISFILIIVIGSILSPLFLNPINIINVLLQNSVFTIIAIGQLFVILTAGIDLSVGSIVALSASLIAGFLQGGISPVLAILIVIIVAGITGSISGTIISYGKVAPFIVTLSMMSIVRGIAYIYQTGADRRIYNMDFINGVAGQIKGIPLPIIYMFLLALLMNFILRRTVFGRAVYAIGGNMETCRLAGIRVNFF
ncbi:MAG: ribose transport system permease protein [Halanaerobiales bacterium]|nr:ribose transport system permease protein [Halanaerobiales bacterium]